MIIHRRPGRLAWPFDSLPLTTVAVDWHGRAVAPPVAFALAIDDAWLWLVATRAAPASVLPGATPGTFVAGLWRSDVAELFLGRLNEPSYLEVNLAPNGAWWTCEFTAPRVRRHEADRPIDGVRTHASPAPASGWRAALGLPLPALGARFRLGARSTVNVTFVLDAPDPRHVTAAAPVPGPPDFHAADLRHRVSIVAAR